MLALTALGMPSRTLLIGFMFFSCLSLFLLVWNQDNVSSSPSSIARPRRRPRPTRNYAYTTFLAAPWNADENSPDEEDTYYMQTRMLLYQLVHDPLTRSPNNYPFIVLVTEDVSQRKRARLEYEGAIVKEIAKLKPLQHATRKAWQDVLTKLRLFEMIEYDRVTFFDSDHVLTRPVDDIFNDPAATLQYNKNLTDKDAIKPDEAQQPTSYIFASNCGSGGRNHTIPPPQGNNLNAGILVFQPSMDLFNYHLSLTTPEAETRYNGRYPEQGVWGYAHRRDGNMPWTQLDWRWNINWAVYGDLEAGIASLHCKYWDLDHDTRLRDFAMSIKWRMEGFWERMDELR